MILFNTLNLRTHTHLNNKTGACKSTFISNINFHSNTLYLPKRKHIYTHD